MDDVDEGNIATLRTMGELWFDRYGEAALELLTGAYRGPSLKRLDPESGQPVEVQSPAPFAGPGAERT